MHRWLQHGISAIFQSSTGSYWWVWKPGWQRKKQEACAVLGTVSFYTNLYQSIFWFNFSLRTCFHQQNIAKQIYMCDRRARCKGIENDTRKYLQWRRWHNPGRALNDEAVDNFEYLGANVAASLVHYDGEQWNLSWPRISHILIWLILWRSVRREVFLVPLQAVRTLILDNDIQLHVAY